jgi:hypothetical protein
VSCLCSLNKKYNKKIIEVSKTDIAVKKIGTQGLLNTDCSLSFFSIISRLVVGLASGFYFRYYENRQPIVFTTTSQPQITINDCLALKIMTKLNPSDHSSRSNLLTQHTKHSVCHC